jgi:glycosyltransferase involved in cell wall biosynthesis
MILYYDWSSDGRSKASKDIYKKLGFDILVFSTKESYYKKEKGVKNSYGIEKYKGGSILLFLFYHFVFMFQVSFWLIRKILSNEVVLIHIHNMPDYLSLVGVIGKIFGKKILWDIRDITPAVWFSKKDSKSIQPYGFMYHLMLMIQNISGYISDYIICADKFQKDYLIENGLRENKIKIFMNYPLKDIFQWIGTSENGNFRLIYHGTISYRLGLDLALKAIGLVKNDIPNIKFDIIGSGEYVKDLSKIIKDERLDKYITLTPNFIPIEDIPFWARGASGAIISNRRTFVTDNFMLAHKMLEYISMGIPVILPKLKILTSYINCDEAVFYEPNNVIDLARAIKELYSINRTVLSQNASNFFKRNKIDENEKVLSEILGEFI